MIRPRTLASLLVALVLLTAAAWSARAGDPAPEIALPRVQGAPVSLPGLLASGPVLVWFPDVGSAASGSSLAQAAAENGATLVVIPVVGQDLSQVEALAARFPDWIVLHDADGAVTVRYAGEFIPGVSPRQNLFVVNTRGAVTWTRFWPGVPEASLAHELRAAR